MAGFAKHRGVSKTAVTKWKKRGLLVFMPDGKVDVAASDARLTDRPAVYRGGAVKPALAVEPSAADFEHGRPGDLVHRRSNSSEGGRTSAAAADRGRHGGRLGGADRRYRQGRG